MGRYCTSCGSQNDDGARFCRDCGKAMSGSTPSAARSEPTSHGGTGDGMTVGYYLEGFHKFADFEGRSSRAEFWWFTLVLYAIQIAIVVLGTVLGTFSPGLEILSTVILWIHGLGTLIPQLAVGVRRLHDSGRSGWWWLVILVPLVGWIPLLIFWVQPSDAGRNSYGLGPGTRW